MAKDSTSVHGTIMHGEMSRLQRLSSLSGIAQSRMVGLILRHYLTHYAPLAKITTVSLTPTGRVWRNKLRAHHLIQREKGDVSYPTADIVVKRWKLREPTDIHLLVLPGL